MSGLQPDLGRDHGTTSSAPLVAVFVGTDHHPFTRVLDWAAELESTGHYRFVVQHGSTPLPSPLTGPAMMGPAEMADTLRAARAVVTHAGPGSIMDARAHGHIPVVVPRDPRLGEHVDDHQLRFGTFLARSGSVRLAQDRATFRARLAAAVQRGRGASSGGTPPETLARFETLVAAVVGR